jgi:lysophospholipase L1-like esterase
LHAYYAQAGQPLSNMTQQGAMAAALAEILNSTANSPSFQTVQGIIPPTATTARVQIQIDFNPQLSGPSFAVTDVLILDSTDAGGSAGLIFERCISVNATGAVLQFVNQGAGTSNGTFLALATSFTPSISSNPSPDPAIATLLASLTGATFTPCVWTKRINVVVNGTNLIRWDPVSGTPLASIIANQAGKPTVAGPGQPIVCNGTSSTAITAFLPQFNPTQPMTFCVIGRTTEYATGNTPWYCGSATDVGFIDFTPGNNGAGLMGASASNSRAPVFAQPGIKVIDGRVSCYIMTCNGSTTTQTGCLPQTLNSVTAGSAPTSANGCIAIGSESVQGAFAQCEVHAVIWLDHVATQAELNAIYTYAGAEGDPSLTDCSVHDGDSQTYGNGLADFTTNYPTQLIQSALPRTLAALNTGVTSKQLLQAGTGLIATFPTLIAPLFRAGRRNQYLVLWTGTNDFAVGATVAQVLAGIQQYMAQAVSTGFPKNQIILMTVLSRGDVNIDALRDAYNPQAVTLAASLGIQCAPIHTDPIIGIDGAWSNATYFNADHVHPTGAGYTRVIQYLLPIFRATMN